MSATDAIKAACEVGVELGLDGQHLVLSAPAAPPPAVLDLIAWHKADVIAILRAREEDRWNAEDWRACYDERAAIAEFDGGLSRQDAEALAHACCVTEWLNRNPVESPPGQCLGCRQGERPHEPLVPFGTGTTGHAWLHHRCWDAWHARRKAEATSALKAIGIEDKGVAS